MTGISARVGCHFRNRTLTRHDTNVDDHDMAVRTVGLMVLRRQVVECWNAYPCPVLLVCRHRLSYPPHR